MEKKEVLKKGLSKSKGLAGEFKEFISKGNVIDLAVGVIIGAAFGKIVTSLVDDILMPLIGVLIGGIDFSKLSFTIKDASVNYGMFIQNIIERKKNLKKKKHLRNLMKYYFLKKLEIF